MNDDPNTPPPFDESAPDPASEAPGSAQETEPGPFDDFAKSLQDAVKTGRTDARKAFEKAMPRAKEDLSRGAHDLAYAVAYATAFGTALIKEITPDNLSEGFKEGTDAGKRAAEEVIRTRREKAEGQAERDNSETGTSPA
tara:strand:+ start:2344 stop:2763 length:420 start_codon:yes stop_codon:yes gene_type:complete